MIGVGFVVGVVDLDVGYGIGGFDGLYDRYEGLCQLV